MSNDDDETLKQSYQTLEFSDSRNIVSWQYRVVE